MKRHVCHVLLCLTLLLAGCALGAVGASAADPARDFDFLRYAGDNPDVMRAYGPELYQNDLYLHYLTNGVGEGRVAYSLRTGQPFVPEENAAQAYRHQLTLTSVQARLDNAALVPDRSWPEPLLALADQVIAEVGGATPYETLRGCYDWLIQNCSYGSASASMGQGGRIAQDAYAILAGRVGVCDNYSAAFAVMARILGYDARLQGGQTHRAAGGYTGHAWCVINVHGVDYLFDPQIEDNIAAGGAVRYLRFCKTYAEVPDKYVLYPDETVRSSVMAGGDVGPAYSFGEGGSYLAHVNEARAAASLAPMSWDVDLARAALRIAQGEDSSAVLDELKSRTGKSCKMVSGYGTFPFVSIDGKYESAAIMIYGASICILYNNT